MKPSRLKLEYEVRIPGDVRKYAAEQGIAEEEGLRKGMEDKSKEFGIGVSP